MSAFPQNSLANLEKLAATLSVPSYPIDDQTAIKMTDGTSKSSPRETGNCLLPDTDGFHELIVPDQVGIATEIQRQSTLQCFTSQSQD